VNVSLKYGVLNAGLFAVSAVMAVALVEAALRYRYADHVFYNPRPEVWRIQAQLVAQPGIGFAWRPNVSPAENIRLDYADVHPEPLSTDEWGFINAPEAIDERRAAKRVDVCGLGDSFMEMAARPFYTAFQERGLRYYSFAIHRQAPPQYNLIMEKYAVPLHPKWIVYGLFENDFQEADDFDAWRRSKVDWFAYHSGYWCGPPIGDSTFERLTKTYLKGWYSMYYLLRAQRRGDKVSIAGPRAEDVARVQACIQEAKTLALDNEAEFLLLLIPSRQTATGTDTAESKVYDQLASWAMEHGTRTLDLRPTFRGYENPASLYYDQDGHWNVRGVEVAFEQLGKVVVFDEQG
jgi:hypothetical protein